MPTLTALREEKGLSAMDVALAITERKRAIDPNERALNMNAVYAWEAGRAVPSGLNAIVYAEVLEVDPKLIIQLATKARSDRRRKTG